MLFPGVVGVGDAAADGPLDDKSGVWGEDIDAGWASFFGCGVTGTGAGALFVLCASSTSPSLPSKTALASSIFDLRTSLLNKHTARSLFGKDMIRSVNSVRREDSDLETAA
jgi:hypothetical protein